MLQPFEDIFSSNKGCMLFLWNDMYGTFFSLPVFRYKRPFHCRSTLDEKQNKQEKNWAISFLESTLGSIFLLLLSFWKEVNYLWKQLLFFMGIFLAIEYKNII